MRLSGIVRCAAAAVLLPVAVSQGTEFRDSPGLVPVPFGDVQLADGFWKTWQETNRKQIIPYVFRRLEQAGHIDNFTRAAGGAQGPFVGEVYFDSDVYKAIEGAACTLKTHPDAALAAYLDGLIARIAAAQQADGYLHTFTTLRHPRERWKNPGRHELYCAGHLLEAGVAHWEATGKDDLLRVARRLADHVAATFGPEPHKVHFPPEHQGVELGLLRLSSVTGNSRYAELAQFFLGQRGRLEGRAGYGIYGQDHQPVVEQREAVGHAVRATYMYAAMAELAGRAGQRQYMKPLDSIFLDLIRGKMFISGGVGLLQRGKVYESFADPCFLPNDQPDVDTCSVIGLAFWLHRMHLLRPDGRYGDLIERIVYNRLLAGVSLDGARFFYGCPLANDSPSTFDRGPGAQCDPSHVRAKWFRCICCPTNLPRILAAVAGFAYSRGGDRLYIDQYLPGRVKVPMGGRHVELDVKTGYPWEGNITVTVLPMQSAPFSLWLRIPGWARGEEFPEGLYRSDPPAEKVELAINHRRIQSLEIRQGYVRVDRRWEKGDIVELHLPMNVRRVRADVRVKAAEGRVALMRGPLLYCVEGVDHGGRVTGLVLPRGAEIRADRRAGLLGGVTVLRGTALARTMKCGHGMLNGQFAGAPVRLLAVPFYAWDNREPGEMAVWLPETP